MSFRRIVIPDIHGCARTFAALLFDVLRIRSSDIIYLLGDYTDRGPRSREVIDSIRSLADEGYQIRPLRGNHEEMLLKACGSLDDLRLWTLNGGRTTLESFGVDDPCEIPLSYRSFIAGLPFFLELDDSILVHAGLNLQIVDPFEDTEAMLWSRSVLGDPERIGHKKIISGHTPVSRETIKQSVASERILLDNGCVYADRPELGTLTALELNSMSLYFQINID
jgi:serine/threonine protein phosphatase 1